jgi:hypothetical protein
VILLFDSPRTIRKIGLEVEELEVNRSCPSPRTGTGLSSWCGRSSTLAHQASALNVSSGQLPSEP